MSIKLWFKSLWYKIDFPNLITKDGALKRSCPHDCEICAYLWSKREFPTAKVHK